MTGGNDRYEFASDNTAGMMPELLAELPAINSGATAGYGRDEYTARARKLLSAFFERDCEVFFVFNGTAANVLLLASMAARHEHVIAHPYSHLENDECSAPEFFGAGTKVRGIGGAGSGAKITLFDLQNYLTSGDLRGGDVHFSPPGVLSLTQSTELGTVYDPVELKALTALAHAKGIRTHMDGARFFYALEASGCSPADLTWKAGIDTLSLGGTKIGMGPTEAVVVFDRKAAKNFHYFQKQGAQLASKMRFLSAPWIPLLEKSLWRQAASRANGAARDLAARFEAMGIAVPYRPQVNAVFAQLPASCKSKLEAQGWHAYDFQEGTTRFMTSWLTTPALIDELTADVKVCL
jgi:threonine aldolase